MEEMKELAAILAITVLLFVVIGLGATKLVCTLDAISGAAAIEQLRVDVQRVTGTASEDVIGQVTEWNQAIKSYQRYRTIWWGRLFVPKAWETVRIIVINPANEKGE